MDIARRIEGAINDYYREDGLWEAVMATAPTIDEEGWWNLAITIKATEEEEEATEVGITVYYQERRSGVEIEIDNFEDTEGITEGLEQYLREEAGRGQI